MLLLACNIEQAEASSEEVTSKAFVYNWIAAGKFLVEIQPLARLFNSSTSFSLASVVVGYKNVGVVDQIISTSL